jgi:hypothetical protein
MKTRLILPTALAAVALLAAAASAHAQTCPASIKGSRIPSRSYAPSSPKPGYYAADSAILTRGGIPKVNSATYAQVKTSMGGAFSGAKFKLPNGGEGARSNLPPHTFECQYDGPAYRSGSQTLSAVVAIVCTGSSCPGL